MQGRVNLPYLQRGPYIEVAKSLLQVRDLPRLGITPAMDCSLQRDNQLHPPGLSMIYSMPYIVNMQK